MNEIEKVISIALAEEGYLEKKSKKDLDSKTANAGDKNYTKYARDLDALGNFYNGPKQSYAWCDVFVDWCFVQAFGVDRALELLCQSRGSCGAGVGFSCDYYKNKGQFHASNPQVGDQIFFKDSKGNRTHTGLVYKVDNKYVYTIEGNTSSASGVVANGGCVRCKKYLLSSTSIYGYGRPKYKVEPIKITSKDFKAKDYKFIKAKYIRRTPIVADNKIKYADFAKATQDKCVRDALGYAKTKIGASFYLSKFQDDYKGNVWGMYKGKYSNIWMCVHDSTGYQVK